MIMGFSNGFFFSFHFILNIVNHLIFVRVLFLLIFANLLARKCKILTCTRPVDD